MKKVWVSISKLCDKDNIVFPTKTFIIINKLIVKSNLTKEYERKSIL